MKPVVVSVIMAAYNSERFIGAAIESILRQTYQEFELLIIEDGSTDGTLAVIQSYTDKRIRVLINDKNRGTLYSMRHGVSEARGEYIAVLDSDDVAEPERLRKQVAILRRKPEVLLCATKVKNLVNGKAEKRQYLPIKNARQLRFSLLFGDDMTVHSSIMFRKKELQEKGIQYETYDYCHDYHLIMCVGLLSPIYVIDEELGFYRIHSRQKTNVLSKSQIDMEVCSAKEEFIWKIKGLGRKEKRLLTKAVKGELKKLYEFIALKFLLYHYARICHLHITNMEDVKLIRYEFYRMFVMQHHNYRWYIYNMIEFYLRNGNKTSGEWNQIW